MEEKDDLLDPSSQDLSSGRGLSTIPNANAVLTLGILSIALCWIYGLPGLVCGIIALSLFKNVKKIHSDHPDKYAMSYKNAYAGYVCAIIGTSLSALYIILVIFAVAFGTTLMRL